MKKRFFKVFVLLISISMLLNSISFVNSNAVTTTMSATWNEYFDSEAEMSMVADVIIYGTVIDTIPELRYDMVFTMNHICIDKIEKSSDFVQPNDVIKVLQTGGTYNNISTPEIDDSPLLKLNCKYKLYLQYVTDSENYSDYFLILGGFQGVFEVLNGEILPISDEHILFNNTLASTASTDSSYTPRVDSMYYWDKTSLKVLVPSSIGTTYMSNTRSGICDGVSSWELCSDAPSVTVQSAPGYGSDVAVSMQNYGAVGWDGLSHVSYYTDSKKCTTATIKINVYYYQTDDDLNDRIFWKSIASHEMGHVFGLGHNTDYSVTSVMRPYTKDVYNRYADWPRIATGREADIYTMNLIY